MHRAPSSRLLAPLLALLLAQVATAAPSTRYAASAQDRHAVRVSSPAVSQSLLNEGAERRASYNGFEILDVNAAALADLAGNAAVEDADESTRLHLNVGDIHTTVSASTMARRALTAPAGPRLNLVQFAGPIKPEWRTALTAAGARIIGYIPNNAYLVYGAPSALTSIATLATSSPHIRWQGEYLATDKIQPSARTQNASGTKRTLSTDQFAIQLVDDPAANAATLGLIQSVALAPIRRQSRVLDYLNVIVRVPADQLAAIAAQPDVVSISLYANPTKFDERQGQIVAGNLTGSQPSGPGYLTWLTNHGFAQTQFLASAFVVDVTDSGLDDGTTNMNHFALHRLGDPTQPSRVAYSRLEGTPNAGSTIQACDGHGNLNAHIIAGYDTNAGFPHLDSTGYQYGLGICPFTRVGQSVIFDSDNFTSPVYEDLISRAYRDGARISSDSWGGDTAGAYDVDAQSYDALVRDAQPTGSAVPVAGNQEMTIVFAAGNAGPSLQTVGSPGTAKNVITVGAAENVRSHATAAGGGDTSGNDGCTTPDAEANSAQDMATFSSRGPCSDNRQKPEIVAPGTHVTGGAPQNTASAPTGNGNGLACFNGTGVCALPGGGSAGSVSNFFPLGEQFFTTSSGTSHSTPCVAGGCALVRQWFINHALTAPSPAMTKAFLVNAARYMTGDSANDNLWSPHQGMGEMNLGTAFDGSPRVIRDQLANDTFTASGQSRVIPTTISSAAQPVRVTLAWTDAPGTTSGNAYVNDLNLVVSVGSQTYRGNVFTNALSRTGGTADPRNNCESVFLPAGVSGAMIVTVSAANIAGDGVPNSGTSLDQDFALVVYNATFGATNQAPILTPIGDKSGRTNQVLQFSVSASDPSDGDIVTLAATDLPAWASFPTTSAVASVTGTFTGQPPSNGTYAATFASSDRNGTNTETIAIRVADRPANCGVIFSEYVEGSSNNKAVEIFNGTEAAIDLAAGTYVVEVYANGAATPNNTITLTGTVAAGDVFVLANPGASSILGVADQTSGSLSHTGDDALVLKAGGTIIDSIGVVGTDPGTEWGTGLTSTADNTLRRKTTVTTGDINTADAFDPATEWDGYATDTFAGLGEHFSDCGGSATPPTRSPPLLTHIGNRSVIASNTLHFAVTATPTDADVVTLSVSNLPAGATFSSTNQNGAFDWPLAAPAGAYPVTFIASDADGATNETITITVSAANQPANCGVIFSEYVEGSSNNKAVEIYNGSDSAINLASDTYVVQVYVNGASSPGASIALTGTVAAGATYVLANTSASATILGVANQTSGSLSHNGDDALVLRKGGASGTIVDSIGVVGTDPGSEWGSGLTSTADNTLRRKSSVTAGDTAISDAFDPATEWDGFASDTFAGLGSHIMNCAAPAGTPPILAPIGDHTTLESNSVHFAVTAIPTEANPVTLSVSNLPAGATFSATNETGVFDWIAPTPVGLYTTMFIATDADGASSETISIAVNPHDSNQNGIVDTWEIDNFGMLTNGTDDSDNDGLDNYSEYVAGTQPTNRSSRFVVENIGTTSGARRVTFTAIGGRTYSLGVADRPDAAAQWSNLLEGITGTNQLSVIDSNTVPLRFYRIGVQLQP